MTLTERQPLRYQVAAPNLVCRADLLEAQAFEVEVKYGEWDYIKDEYNETHEVWVNLGKVTVVVAAFDREDAEKAIAGPLDEIDARRYAKLPFKTV